MTKTSARETRRYNFVIGNLLLKLLVLIVLQFTDQSDLNRLFHADHSASIALVEAGRSSSSGLIYNRDGKFIYRPPKSSGGHIIVIDDRTHPRENNSSASGNNNKGGNSNNSNGSGNKDSINGSVIDNNGNSNINNNLFGIDAGTFSQQQQSPIQLFAAPAHLLSQGNGASFSLAGGDTMMRRLANTTTVAGGQPSGAVASAAMPHFQIITLADLTSGRQPQVMSNQQLHDQATTTIGIGQKLPTATAGKQAAYLQALPALATGPNGATTLIQLIPASPQHFAGALTDANFAALVNSNSNGFARSSSGSMIPPLSSAIASPLSGPAADYEMDPELIEMSSLVRAPAPPRAARLDSESPLIYTTSEHLAAAGGAGSVGANSFSVDTDRFSRAAWQRAKPPDGIGGPYYTDGNAGRAALSSSAERRARRLQTMAEALVDTPYERIQRADGASAGGDLASDGHLYGGPGYFSVGDEPIAAPSPRGRSFRMFRQVAAEQGPGVAGPTYLSVQQNQKQQQHLSSDDRPHNINQIIGSGLTDSAGGRFAPPASSGFSGTGNSGAPGGGSAREVSAAPKSSSSGHAVGRHNNNRHSKYSTATLMGISDESAAPDSTKTPPGGGPSRPHHSLGAVKRGLGAGSGKTRFSNVVRKLAAGNAPQTSSNLDSDFVSVSGSSASADASSGNGSKADQRRPLSAMDSGASRFASSDENLVGSYELRDPQIGQQYWRQYSDQFDIIQ